MQEPFDNIRQAIDQLLNVRSAIKRKKQTRQIHNREMFITIINSIQMLGVRGNLAFSELKIDLSTYDEPFLEVIDMLLLLKYGREAYELISFYLWERENPDGSLNSVYDEDNNPIPLDTPIDLWNIILKVNPNIEK